MAEEIIDRPVLKIKWMMLDYVLEIIATIILITTWYYAIDTYNSLPDMVAMHFNLNGEPDGYSHKSGIWALPIVSAILWLLLSIINQFPHAFNFPYALNSSNIERQYKMAQRFMRIVKIWVCIIFLFAIHTTIQTSQNINYRMNFDILVLLASIIIFMAVYLYIAKKK
jgi:uncharacterized membrane protein